MATLHNVVKVGTRLRQVIRRKTPEPRKPDPDGIPCDTGLSTRSAGVVLVGVAVGILVGISAGISAGIGAGLAAGIVAAAAVNGLLRSGG